jgi:hypothetical protein
MDSLISIPRKEKLKQAKINLYQILEEIGEFNLKDRDGDLFFELSCHKEIDEYLESKYE